MSFYIKLYTLDNQFIEETAAAPDNFTGIIDYGFGTKEWWANDKLHRLDGAAVECENGTKEWWINHKQVTEEQHKLYVDIMKLKGLL